MQNKLLGSLNFFINIINISIGTSRKLIFKQTTAVNFLAHALELLINLYYIFKDMCPLLQQGRREGGGELRREWKRVFSLKRICISECDSTINMSNLSVDNVSQNPCGAQ